MKTAVNAAGGDVSLMPLDREDYKRAVRESEELRRLNGDLQDELRESTKRQSALEEELDNVGRASRMSGGGGGGEGGEEEQAMDVGTVGGGGSGFFFQTPKREGQVSWPKKKKKLTQFFFSN